MSKIPVLPMIIVMVVFLLVTTACGQTIIIQEKTITPTPSPTVLPTQEMEVGPKVALTTEATAEPTAETTPGLAPHEEPTAEATAEAIVPNARVVAVAEFTLTQQDSRLTGTVPITIEFGPSVPVWSTKELLMTDPTDFVWVQVTGPGSFRCVGEDPQNDNIIQGGMNPGAEMVYVPDAGDLEADGIMLALKFKGGVPLGFVSASGGGLGTLDPDNDGLTSLETAIVFRTTTSRAGCN